MANGDYVLRNYYYQLGLTKATEMEITDLVEGDNFAKQYEEACIQKNTIPQKFGWLGGKLYYGEANEY